METQTNHMKKNILENKWVQIILKSFLNGDFDKYLWYFTTDNKFDKAKFDNLLYYIETKLKEKWFFIYTNKDFEEDIVDNKEWVENIQDILEWSDDEVKELNKKDKSNIKEGIEKYIIKKIDNIESLETKMKLMNLFRD